MRILAILTAIALLLTLLQVQSMLRYLDDELDGLKGQIRLLEERTCGVEEYIEQWQMGEFEATAYTLECGNGDGYTATMTIPREGVIAVDPKVIPLGSKVYVSGRGWFSAEDTGGLIKGRKIDIFMDSLQSALTFGRQSVTVMYRGES